jgi:alkylation response protein AidB-like acyl-CoA dehydrogenase
MPSQQNGRSINHVEPAIDHVARMRAIMPLIESEADASNQALKLTQPVVDAFAEGGFFKLMAPKELGGLEADPDTIIDVLADCTYADGSAGWNLVVNTSSLSTCAYIDPAKAREIVSLKNGASGGAINPWRGVANEEKGGYRVAGQYALGSATSHATHITSGAMLHRDGQPALNEAGIPQIRVFFLPKANVVHDDDWDVLGLSGSGSFDYVVPEQFVEEGWCWNLQNPVVRSGGTFS